MFDLSTIAAAETGVLHLRDGADNLLYAADGSPVTITIYGPGSKPYAAAKSVQQTRMIAKLNRKGGVEETPEVSKKHEAEFLVTITAEMSGVEYKGLQGKELFRAIYSSPELGFVSEQVNKFAGDWANFSKGSVKS